MKKLLFILIMAIMAGCNGGDDPVLPTLNLVSKASITSSTGTVTQRYTYDNKGRITLIANDNQGFRIEVAYDPLDNVQKISETQISTLLGGRITTKIDQSFLFQGENPFSVTRTESNQLPAEYRYTIVDGKVTEMRLVGQGPPLLFKKFTYTGNNVTKVEEYKDGKVVSTLTMTYGTAKNPRANARLKHLYSDEFLFMYSENDLTGSTLIDNDGKVVSTYLNTINENGYPSKVETTINYFNPDGSADGTNKTTTLYEYL